MGRAVIAKKYCRIGNLKKLMNITDWELSVDFNGMVKMLLADEGFLKK